MALSSKFLHTKMLDGLVEVSDRVYVLSCCFASNIMEYDKHRVWIKDIMINLQMNLPDASFMVFNFQEGEKEVQVANFLSDYNITVMNYPQQYKSCTILPMGMIHNFLTLAENWLSLGHYNVLLVHCECGGWPIMSFMLAKLLIYRNQHIGKQKTLEMIYKLVCLFRLVTPFNPQQSQLRYLQYISNEYEVPLNRALNLDGVILRFIADFNIEGCFRPILRIYGLDPKLLFSTTKRSILVSQDNQVILSEISAGSSFTTTHLHHTDENEELCDEKSVEDQSHFSKAEWQEPEAVLTLNNTIADSSVNVNPLSNKFDIGQKNIQCPTQAHILSQRIFQKSIPHVSSHINILQAPQVPFQRYHKASSAIGITALLHDHVESESKEITHQVNVSLPSGASNPVVHPSNLQPGIISILPFVDPNLFERNSTKVSPVFRNCQPVSKSHSSSSPQFLSFLPSSSSSLSKTFLNPPSLVLSSEDVSLLQNDLETTQFPIHQEPMSAQPLSLSCPPPPPPPPPSLITFVSESSPSSPIKTLSYDASSMLSHIDSSVTLPAFPLTGKGPPPPPTLPAPCLSNSSRRLPPQTPSPLPPSFTITCLSPKESSCNDCLHAQPVPPQSNPSSNRMLKVGVPSKSAGENRYVSPVPVPPLGAKGRLQLHSGARNQIHHRRSLKPYHWLKLTRAMQGSFWAEAQKSDEFYKVPEFDMSELESLFSASIPNSDIGNTGRKFGLRASGANCDKIHLIDLRRAYNCEIMLTKVKLPLSELLSPILSLDDSSLDADQVDNLIKFCPNKEEIELLKNYSGSRQELGKCEQFFFELMKVQRVESKLRVFSFKILFNTQVSDLRKSLNIINSVTEEIRNSVKLKRIMHTILSLGNALNHGTARGSAIGFRLDSLLKLIDTRARNNKMTLMHYLCKFLSEKLPELLDFPKELMSLESSTKIQLKYLAEEMQSISKGLERVAQELVASANDGPLSNNFCKILKEFLDPAELEVKHLSSLYSKVGRNVDALALYFGEDPSRIQFEQVVSTLLSFVRMFIRAHEENLRQHGLEEKKI